MLRTLWGDDDRYKKQYWSELPGFYFAGDGARFDKDGYLWVVGRIDDVLNVSGHRIGTAEVESALVSHPSVAEAAVVGRPDDLKGQALVCFVTVKNGIAASPDLKEMIRAHVAREIGSLARPTTCGSRRAPQDPQRQNHAAHPQGDRRRRHGEGRHDDARGFLGRGRAPGGGVGPGHVAFSARPWQVAHEKAPIRTEP
jgi:acyl-CoA synthetase (AMP-forming)/AMP-acid ligase II